MVKEDWPEQFPAVQLEVGQPEYPPLQYLNFPPRTPEDSLLGTLNVIFRTIRPNELLYGWAIDPVVIMYGEMNMYVQNGKLTEELINEVYAYIRALLRIIDYRVQNGINMYHDNFNVIRECQQTLDAIAADHNFDGRAVDLNKFRVRLTQRRVRMQQEKDRHQALTRCMIYLALSFQMHENCKNHFKNALNKMRRITNYLSRLDHGLYAKLQAVLACMTQITPHIHQQVLQQQVPEEQPELQPALPPQQQ